MTEDPSSAFQFISWAFLFPLFIYSFGLIDKLSHRLYPRLIADENRRNLFNLAALPLLMFVFGAIWSFALEWYYL